MHSFAKTTMNVIILTFFVYVLNVQEASANQKKRVDYRYIYKRLNTRKLESSCRIQGYQCSSCTEVIFCYSIDDEWFVDAIEQCPDGTTCSNGDCTIQASRECLGENINKCGSTEGMYPDPSSCKQFTYCVPGSDPKKLNLISSKCEFGYSYNSLTTYCDKILPGDICAEYPVPECVNSTQSGPLVENPTIYYACGSIPGIDGIFFPYLDACKNGKKFDSTAKMCT